MDDDRKTGGLDAISLRDHFAGLAMAQMLVGAYLPTQREWERSIAKASYELADAMLAARDGVSP